MCASRGVLASVHVRVCACVCVCMCMCMRGLQGMSVSACPWGTCESAPLCQRHLCHVCLCVPVSVSIRVLVGGP